MAREHMLFRAKDGRRFTLRSVTRGDLGSMVAFANLLADEKRRNSELGVAAFDRKVTREEERKFLDRCIEGLAKRRYVSVGAFEGRRMVGNCDVVGRAARDVKHTGTLGIVLLADCRRIGLGEAMIRRALAGASRTGIWVVDLEVFSSNHAARRLYEKVGFREAGVIPKKFQRNGGLVDSVQMYTHLPHKQYIADGGAPIN